MRLHAIGISPDRRTVQDPLADAGVHLQTEDMYQVILHNDDHNAMEHVIVCLMRVFSHPEVLAAKIMIEAHQRGRAIAEVETRGLALNHRDQLQALGLVATAEPI